MIGQKKFSIVQSCRSKIRITDICYKIYDRKLYNNKANYEAKNKAVKYQNTLHYKSKRIEFLIEFFF